MSLLQVVSLRAQIWHDKNVCARLVFTRLAAVLHQHYKAPQLRLEHIVRSRNARLSNQTEVKLALLSQSQGCHRLGIDEPRLGPTSCLSRDRVWGRQGREQRVTQRDL